MFRFAAYLALATALSSAAPESPAQPSGGDMVRGSREVMDAIQLNHPDAHARIRDAIGRYSSERPDDSSGRSALTRQMLLEYFRSRAEGLANAPPSLIAEIVARHRMLLRLLAKDDAALCADLANNFLIGRFDLPAFYQDRATSLAALIVEAAAEGEKRPKDPARSALAAEDLTRWYEELLRVEPASDIQAAIAADSAATSNSPEMQCRVGAAIYGAMENLPPETAANVGAFFLAQDLAEAGLQEAGN